MEPVGVTARQAIWSLSMHVKEFPTAQFKPNQAIPIDALRANIRDQLGAVAQREDNWDDRESKKPSTVALNNARRLMEELLDSVISTAQPWLTPFISSDEDGHITVAWHKGEHEFHLIVTDKQILYISVWGINIETEMDMDVLSKHNYVPLWTWLLDG